MAAENIDISEFSITGDLGADGTGQVVVDEGKVPSFDWYYHSKIVYAGDPKTLV